MDIQMLEHVCYVMANNHICIQEECFIVGSPLHCNNIFTTACLHLARLIIDNLVEKFCEIA